MHCECTSSKSLTMQLIPILWHAILVLYTLHLSKIRIMSLIGEVDAKAMWYSRLCVAAASKTPPPWRVHTRIRLARLRSTPCPWTSNPMWPMKSSPSTLIRFSHTGVSKQKDSGIRILIWYIGAVKSFLLNNSVTASSESTDDEGQSRRKQQL